MTRTQISAIAIAFATLFAGQAMAASDAPITRAQVKAELAEAVHSGNVIVGEDGALLNEVFPHNYAAQQTSQVSRAQVKAELAEAIRSGNMSVSESGVPLNKVFPHNYAQQDVGHPTRAEIKAELAEAIANGLHDRHIEA